MLDDAYIYTTPEIEVENGQLFADLRNEMIANLITTKNDLNAEYESYKQKYFASGGDKWIEQATAIYKNEHGM
jgi:putative aldouronate transport system substrate-binding protein